MLTVDRLTKRYGGLTAVDDVSLVVDRGEIRGLIGPNGAGKSTLVGLISGFIPPTSGQVRFGDTPVTGKRPHEVARAGIVRTFQHTAVYPDFTVRESLELALQGMAKEGFLARVVAGRNAGRRGQVRARCDELMQRLGLGDYADVASSAMPYGRQRALGVAMALACSPSVLLLDEPAAGLTPSERADVGAMVREIASGDISVILVEHDVAMVTDLCDRILVLNEGRTLADGTPDAVRADPLVIEAYLGSDE